MAELFLLTFDRAGITQLHRTAQGANLATLVTPVPIPSPSS